MFKKIIYLCMVLIFVLILSGCGLKGSEPVEPTPDTQATVDAAIAGTLTAQAEIAAQIEAAVQATVTAMPATDPSSYEELSEEELALLIEQHVDETMTASEQVNSTTTAATSDGTITQEEYDEIETYVYDMEAAIALTEELIYAYYGLYGELAMETLYLLEEVEGDLDDLAYVATEMLEILIEVEDAWGTGAEVAVEVLDQLDAAAQVAQEKIPELQEKRDTWLSEHQSEIEGRIAELQNLVPTEVAGNRREAILGAFDYVDAVREGLGDRQLNPTELRNIAQLGVNAQAGLDSFGGPNMQGLSGNIGEITNQLARGQTQQAIGGLGQLEGKLGDRPKR